MRVLSSICQPIIARLMSSRTAIAPTFLALSRLCTFRDWECGYRSRRPGVKPGLLEAWSAILLTIVCLAALSYGCTRPNTATASEAQSRPERELPPADVTAPVKLINDFLAGLESDKSNEIPSSYRRPAAELSNSGSPAAIEPLMRLAKSKWKSVNADGSLALGRLVCSKKVEPVLQLLKSDGWWLRRNGTWILGRSQHREATVISALVQLLKDDEWEVRMYAAWALGRLQAKPAISALADLAKQHKDKRDGAEAENAVGVIRNGLYAVDVANPPLWLIIAEQDMPRQAMNIGTIMTIEGPADHLFGYTVQETGKERPLKLAFLQEGSVVYFGGEGTIGIADGEKVRLSGPYDKAAVE